MHYVKGASYRSSLRDVEECRLDGPNKLSRFPQSPRFRSTATFRKSRSIKGDVSQDLAVFISVMASRHARRIIGPAACTHANPSAMASFAR
jgi:hypothetical protein